jgi:hypothetical protein
MNVKFDITELAAASNFGILEQLKTKRGRREIPSEFAIVSSKSTTN